MLVVAIIGLRWVFADIFADDRIRELNVEVLLAGTDNLVF